MLKNECLVVTEKYMFINQATQEFTVIGLVVQVQQQVSCDN